MSEKLNAMMKGKGLKAIVFLGLAGILLILFSDMTGDDETQDNTAAVQDTAAVAYEQYIDATEERLRKTLEKINGVGKADVMITAVGSGEYVYAQNSKRESDPDSVSESGEYVIIGGNGDKKALVRKVDNPEIMGVVVVCEGGESNVVKEKVYNAVSAAFGIPSQKIFVTGSK